MALSILSQNLVTLQNSVVRAIVEVDSGGVATDPIELKVDLMDLSGAVVTTDTWTTLVPGARIVHPSTGVFYMDFGNQLVNNETNSIAEGLINWRVLMSVGGEYTNSIQKLKIISHRAASFVPELKLLIDKSRKLVNQSTECYLGYEDHQIISYLEGGIQNINAYQPSLTFTLESYPLEQKQILIDASLITGVMSQELFAIDTDVQNYNDQGVSLVVLHQPQLAAFLNSLVQRLDRIIPMMKLQYISPGTVHVQQGPNFRLTQLIQAAPGGSLFRNVFFKG